MSGCFLCRPQYHTREVPVGAMLDFGMTKRIEDGYAVSVICAYHLNLVNRLLVAYEDDNTVDYCINCSKRRMLPNFEREDRWSPTVRCLRCFDKLESHCLIPGCTKMPSLQNRGRLLYEYLFCDLHERASRDIRPPEHGPDYSFSRDQYYQIIARKAAILENATQACRRAAVMLGCILRRYLNAGKDVTRLVLLELRKTGNDTAAWRGVSHKIQYYG